MSTPVLLSMAVLAVVLGASLLVGAADLTPAAALAALTSPDGSAADLIVRTVRVPRAAIGAAVGACLAVSGAIAQGLTRNPLAAPGILGVNAGAALGIVAFGLVAGEGSAAVRLWAALLGGGAAAALIAGLAVSGVVLQAVTRNPLAAPDVVGVTAGASLATVALIVLAPSAPQALVVPAAAALAGAAPALLVALRRGGSSIQPIVVGIGVGAVSHALVTLMLTYGQVAAVGEALVWMAGSVYARGFEHVRLLVLWAGLLAPRACLLARHLDVLDLGDDVARGLGLRVARLRGMLLVLGVGLAGAAVAAAGTVGFVGLLAPHMARRVAGVSHRHLVPAGALIGALVTVLADTVGRTLFAPIELPCGVLTAAFGAPYLIARLAGGPGR